MKRALLVAIISILLFPTVASAGFLDFLNFGDEPAVGGGNIETLDVWTATTGPAITQRAFGRTIKITGLSDGCLQISGSIVSSTGSLCGSGGGGGTDFSTTSANYWASLGYGFSTTSANAWSALGYGFSTTSTNSWLTGKQGAAFSTTSALYFTSLGYGWSTTSANAWSALGYGWSTTSANAFLNATSTFSTSSTNFWLNASTTQSLPGCASNQIPKWNGTKWACSADDNSGGGGSLFGQTWEITGGYLAPTTTLGIIVNAASSTITNLTTTNATATAATTTSNFTSSGSTIVSAMTLGSVFFAGTGGLVSQDNGNLFWNDSLNRLGVGTSSPTGALEVGNSSAGGVSGYVTNGNTGTGAFADLNVRNSYDSAASAIRLITLGTGFTTNGAFVQDSGALFADLNLSGGLSIVARNAAGVMRFYTGGFADANERIRILSGGNVGIGSTTPASLLSVHGASLISGNTFIGANLTATGTLKISPLLKTIPPNFYPSFSYATTTTWTGTTTIPLGPAFIGETWEAVMCFTDTGTLNISFNDGTNRMDMLNASTTVGTVTFTTNSVFTAAEKRYVDIGTPGSSPKSISCTVSKFY